MSYGYLLPPDPRRDPLQEEIKILQAQQGVSQKAANGRFLPPGTLSKKAQKRSGRLLEPSQDPGTYRSALHDEIEASMLGAELPPEAPPTLPPDESAPTPEDTRADYVQAWRQKKRGQTSFAMPPQDVVVSVPPSPTRATPTPLAGDCDAAVFLRLHGKRLLVECTLQGPHPNQPHMHKIDPVEEGDTVFLGWWHQGE